MSSLSTTLIDVGWGDSIFIESQDNAGSSYYALVDSNDTTNYRSSFIFIKKFFERRGIRLPDDKPIFEFVVLTHAHADHGQGLKRIFQTFGTRNFWYPKSLAWSGLASLISYSNRSSNVVHHQAIDNTKIMPPIGDATMEILWPLYGDQHINTANENNNSIVFTLTLNNVSFVLTGDAEEDVWNNIASQIPNNTLFFKVPHHGSVNGTFDQAGNTPWINNCPRNALLGISSHVRPHSHPDPQVVSLFNNNQFPYYRTDEQYHLTFSTDGQTVSPRYSH